MIRSLFFILSFASLFFIITLQFIWPDVLYLSIFVLPLITLGIYDIYFSHHNVLKLYPIIGHLRYILEFIRPEIQQYFIASNQSGRPYNREIRDLIYRRAKDTEATLPFGTQQDITSTGYEFVYHSMINQPASLTAKRILIGAPDNPKSYSASLLNISAMSFGALSSTAILALNKGAKLGGFAHNTGEGGLSRYHLEGGGDLIWQIGTGYFGCRTQDGHFDQEKFVQKANLDTVKMIEIKLSQGAKPSHGGILPASKVTAEIAEFRGIATNEVCISPPNHSAFSSPEELLNFVALCRKLSNGKPVGFKLCIGIHREFLAICKAMLTTGIIPDFITLDGAEGGTGAAPVEFTNRLGTPINEAISFVHNCLVGINLRQNLRLIASGKIATGFDLVTKIALGADLGNVARAMMFAIGCIQALRCNTNTCPTGITTQDPRRIIAIDVKDKSQRVAHYHAATLNSFYNIIVAMGLTDPGDLSPEHIYRRINSEASKSFADIYPSLHPGELLESNIPVSYQADWLAARPDRF